MKDFERGLILLVVGFMLGCAADGSFQIPAFGFGDKEGNQGECVPISETMQKCKFLKPDGSFFWLDLPIIIIDVEEDTEEKV